MRVSKRTWLTILFSILIGVAAQNVRGATQADLVGNWSGTWDGVPMRFSVDAAGNLSSGVLDPTGNINFVTGTLTAAGGNAVNGNLTLTFPFGGFTLRTSLIVSITAPGAGGAPFRISGTFTDPLGGGIDTIDVSDNAPAPHVFTQASLAGFWSGNGWSGAAISFIVDGAGNVSGTLDPSGINLPVSGKLTVASGSGAVTGNLIFGTGSSVGTFAAQPNVTLSAPGQGGSAFRLTGTFTFGFTLDVSGGPIPPTITSGGSASGNVGLAFSYATSATGALPISFTESGAIPPGTAFTNGVVQGIPTAAGTYTIVVTATNEGGSVSRSVTMMIGPAIPPAFTSPGSITVSAFQNFSTPLAASGSQPIMLSVGALPTGLSFSLGYIIVGKLVVPGTYSVPITATNAAGSVQQMLVINVTPLDPNGNINGDGVPSGIAIKLGLDPSDPAQTPFNGQTALGVTRFSLSKMSIKLKSGADAITLTGSLPTFGRYSVTDQRVTILIGNIVQALQLSKSGSGTATDSNGALKVRIAGGGKGPGTHNAAFQITMKGNYAALLAGSGFDPKSDSMLPVTILFSRTVFTINVAYSAATKSFASTQ